MSKLHRISPQAEGDRVGDVVFVHGLGGDPFSTWQSEKAAPEGWLHWLASDLPDVTIWTLEYSASPSHWLGASMPLIDRAKEIAHLLQIEGLGGRPLIFVGHSLGGLVVKQLLRAGFTQGIDPWRRVVAGTEGVLFLATPHTGANLATWLDRLRIVLRPGGAAQDLTAHNPLLRDLSQWYSNQSAAYGIQTLCFYETQTTKGTLVVDPTSANPGISGVEPIPVDADHLTICKPNSRGDLIYKSVKQFIQDRLLTIGSDPVSPDLPQAVKTTPARIFIAYRRRSRYDPSLARHLETDLRKAGHDVFIDTQLRVGAEWAKEIAERIDWCDFLVVLLSAESIESEAVQAKVRLASQRRRQDGRPHLLPIRVAYDGPLGYELEITLGHYQYVVWRSPPDYEDVLSEILAVVQTPAERIPGRGPATEETRGQPPATGTAARPAPVADPGILRMPGGTVRLDDPLYLRRSADDAVEGEAQITGETIIIKAPRQMGKSSLLIRYLVACREAGKRVVYIDFQRFPDPVLEHYETFLHALANELASRLELDLETPSIAGDSCQLVFDRFVEKTLLAAVDGPITFGFDEVDRLLGRSYQGSFFSLLRGWHNARAELSTCWKDVDLALVISTEPTFLIVSGYESPFNVTPSIGLPPFDRSMLNDLNDRFGQPLVATELDGLHELVGGQPYLSRLALYHLSSARMSFQEMNQHAADNDGPFGDHLRALLIRLGQAELRSEMRQVISGANIDDNAYHRLHGAGLVHREAGRVQPANLLYARFFRAVK